MLTVQFLAIGSYAVKQQHGELHNNSHNIYAIENIFFNQACIPASGNPICPDSKSPLTHTDIQITLVCISSLSKGNRISLLFYFNAH